MCLGIDGLNRPFLISLLIEQMSKVRLVLFPEAL